MNPEKFAKTVVYGTIAAILIPATILLIIFFGKMASTSNCEFVEQVHGRRTASCEPDFKPNRWKVNK
jgi:hypothetical protein